MSVHIHHAILLEVDARMARNKAISLLADMHGLTVTGNPDVHIIEKERFTIDDARSCKEKSYRKPFGEKQVFILIVEKILIEAQNALLKVLEEPSENTFFIISVPSRNILLPTLLSRLLLLKEQGIEEESQYPIQKYVQGTISVRKKLVEPVIKEKDRVQARIFLDELERHLATDTLKNTNALKEVSFVRSYIRDTSSSLKMLLEHVCVSI